MKRFILLIILFPAQVFAHPNEDLLRPAKDGNLANVKTAIAKKSNVNVKDKDGYTLLAWATRHDHIEVIKLLITAKADVNLKSTNGDSALKCASYEYHTEIFDLLKAAGAKE